MEQINNLFQYNSNSDEDNRNKDNIFLNIIQAEVGDDSDEEVDDADGNVHEVSINNVFLHPIDQQKGVTGTMFEHNGVAYLYYCLYGELYYASYKI